MCLYFKGLQTLNEKRKYNRLHFSDRDIYSNAFNRLLVPVYAFIDVSAFVGSVALL